MNRRIVWAFSLLTAFLMPLTGSLAKPSGDPMPGLYRTMLKDYTNYAETLWQMSPQHTDMGYWGTGRGDWNNEGIRAVSTTALVYAYLHRSGDTSFRVSGRVEPALRWCAETHVTGHTVCTDGKRWGNGWQTAMWAGNVGVAAWLVRDELDPQVMRAVCRVVAAEADRFIGVAPPDMQPGDTKAEENAWNLTASSSALLLMPNHAHAAKWRETVLKWGFNTISCEADKVSREVLEGKPVGEWVATAQVFPDFTLENHGIFHPVYAMVGPATNGQAAVTFRLAGKPVPDALKYNVLKEWEMLRYITPADGEWLYPQGLDWDLHDYEHIHYFAMLATLFQRPEAALLETRLAGYARRRQARNGNGAFVGPSGSLGFARESVQAERVTFAAMMHDQFGAAPTASAADYDRMERGLEPAKAFERAGFVVHRTQRGLTSFSWNHQLMGLAMPRAENHLDQPYLTTPWQGSLTGRFTLEGQNSKSAAAFTVLNHNVKTDANGYRVTVDAITNDGALRQTMAVASIAPGVLAYLDRVVAVKTLTVTEECGLPVAIENDEVSGNRRTLVTAAGRTVIAGGSDKDFILSANWVNVDDRLGMVSIGSPMLYRAAGKTNRPGAREDYLFGAYRKERRAFNAGGIVSERAGLILLDATVAETEALAKSATFSRTAETVTLTFETPDGKSQTLSLKGIME